MTIRPNRPATVTPSVVTATEASVGGVWVPLEALTPAPRPDACPCTLQRVETCPGCPEVPMFPHRFSGVPEGDVGKVRLTPEQQAAAEAIAEIAGPGDVRALDYGNGERLVFVPRKDATVPTETIDSIADVYKRIAIKWMMWEWGMTAEEAAAVLAQWPVHGKASSAIDVATFIVEECHGS